MERGDDGEGPLFLWYTRRRWVVLWLVALGILFNYVGTSLAQTGRQTFYSYCLLLGFLVGAEVYRRVGWEGLLEAAAEPDLVAPDCDLPELVEAGAVRQEAAPQHAAPLQAQLC